MKLRLLIADDEALSRARLRDLIAAQPDLRLVAECSDGNQALHAIREHSPDVVFLDVRMPELDGFGVLKALKGHRLPAVVFVTAHDEFAVRAFEVHAVDYLLKPFDKDRFQTALNRARTWLQKDSDAKTEGLLSVVMAALQSSPRPLERLPIKANGRISILSVEEIDWICAAGNYAELHLGKRSHLLRAKLKTLADQLSANRFVQISRSHLVNIDRIKEVSSRPHGDYEVVLLDGTRLLGSRTYRHHLSSLLAGEL